jgi:hypothetical protein
MGDVINIHNSINNESNTDNQDLNSNESHIEHYTRDKKNKIYHYLLDQLRKNKYIYSKSSEYYRYMNLKMVIPCLFLSSLASIISFVSSSGAIADSSKNYFALSVGVIASLSTLIQSINSNVGFATKNELFEKCADEYAKLIIKVEFEMLAPNEHYQQFVNDIEEQMNKIQQSCKYFPPQFIIDDYIKNKKELDELDDDDDLTRIVVH